MYVSGFHHTKEQLETSEMLGEHHFDILMRRRREENMNIPLAHHSQLLTRERHRAGGAAAPLGQNPCPCASASKPVTTACIHQHANWTGSRNKSLTCVTLIKMDSRFKEAPKSLQICNKTTMVGPAGCNVPLALQRLIKLL